MLKHLVRDYVGETLPSEVCNRRADRLARRAHEIKKQAASAITASSRPMKLDTSRGRHLHGRRRQEWRTFRIVNSHDLYGIWIDIGMASGSTSAWNGIFNSAAANSLQPLLPNLKIFHIGFPVSSFTAAISEALPLQSGAVSPAHGFPRYCTSIEKISHKNRRNA